LYYFQDVESDDPGCYILFGTYVRITPTNFRDGTVNLGSEKKIKNKFGLY